MCIRDRLYSVSTPIHQQEVIRKTAESLFGIITLPIPNFLCLTLYPSNQIIHPGRMYGIFQDWDGKKSFEPNQVPFLYEDMDDISADMLQKLDDEIQMIKNAIQQKNSFTDLSSVLPLKERIIFQYGEQIANKSNLKEVFRTNQGYKTARVPVRQVENGKVIPEINSRLFFEDIPYGLCILKDLAELLNLSTPAIDLMIEWHQKLSLIHI
eukprot:TRINITY_DN4507_c0_g1_i6.p1 TRINITY_DN4507_c0_g1~~TRINITY_DN4507_c0_g1_i6.p1  ORF type:complete len:210 (+),score=36.52 TRINITY_DN4507_c0_g1_i6:108-737(+)